MGRGTCYAPRLTVDSQASDYFHDFATTSFAGVTCAQIWADFALWECLLNEHPDVAGIIEIGTWKGGFALYLGAQAAARGIGFFTCDAVVPDVIVPGFQRLDVFADPGRIEEVADEMGGPVVLLCDGGNKPRELRTFPPLMPAGSIVVVHDWMTETLPSDVPDFLFEIYGVFCDAIGSVSRVFEIAS